MLHKVFNYVDYDGNEKTIDADFNLSKNDCIDLDRAFEDQGGLISYLTSLIKDSKEHPNEPPKDTFVRFVRVLVSKGGWFCSMIQQYSYQPPLQMGKPSP